MKFESTYRLTVATLVLLAAGAAVVLVSCEPGADIPAAPTTRPDSAPTSQPAAGLPAKTVEAVKILFEKAEFVVLGEVEAVYDRTAKDAGMLYDVEIEKVFKGEWAKKSLRFRSAAWIGYAKYARGERVLLFVRYFGDERPELIQLKPVVYLSPPQPGALDLRPVEKYLELIESLPANQTRAACIKVSNELTIDVP